MEKIYKEDFLRQINGDEAVDVLLEQKKQNEKVMEAELKAYQEHAARNALAILGEQTQ